jgi:hypothetical protein
MPSTKKECLLDLKQELIQDVRIEDQLYELERAAWPLFKNVIINLSEITTRKTTVMWWLTLYSTTQLWGVECL